MFQPPLSISSAKDRRLLAGNATVNEAEPAAALESSVYRASFWKLVNGLEPDQARVLKLRLGLEGDVLTPAAAGVEMGLTAGQINTLFAEAKTALRTAFSFHPGFDTAAREQRYDFQRAELLRYKLAA